MTVDEKIDFILQHIPNAKDFSLKAFYEQHWPGDAADTTAEVVNTMQKNRLINLSTYDQGIIQLTILGQRVVANGGWLKFVEERKKSEQLKHEQEAEYQAMIERNKVEKEANEQKRTTTVSNKLPTSGEKVPWKTYLAILVVLLLIAYFVLRKTIGNLG